MSVFRPCYLLIVTQPKEIIVHPTGRFTAAMHCGGRVVILCGLAELPQVGFQFEADGHTWEVVDDRGVPWDWRP